jgi:hypothetical protein
MAKSGCRLRESGTVLQKHAIAREGREGSEIATQLIITLERLGQARPDSEIHQILDNQVQRLLDQVQQTKRYKISAPTPRSQLLRLYKANHKVVHVRFGQWQIPLVTEQLTSRMLDGHVDTEVYSALHAQHAFNTRAPPIAACFGDIIQSSGQLIKVFNLVECDDLNGLMRLLAVGKASIRDYDAQGRSLPFVSITTIVAVQQLTVYSTLARMRASTSLGSLWTVASV